MKESMLKRIEKLEHQLKQPDFTTVIFQINGQDDDGDRIEPTVVIKDEVMCFDKFNEKYPNFKPNGISIVIKEWDE